MAVVWYLQLEVNAFAQGQTLPPLFGTDYSIPIPPDFKTTVRKLGPEGLGEHGDAFVGRQARDDNNRSSAAARSVLRDGVP